MRMLISFVLGIALFAPFLLPQSPKAPARKEQPKRDDAPARNRDKESKSAPKTDPKSDPQPGKDAKDRRERMKQRDREADRILNRKGKSEGKS